MEKPPHPVTNWLADRLKRLTAWLERSGSPVALPSKFVDLAPTDEADAAGVYSEALREATENVRVRNIALTGPYGSGKSSIIQTFLKAYSGRALHISLAAFVPETAGAGGSASRQEIERSILQQMLYGADANKLPLSRFKRIQMPGPWSAFRSFFIMLGLLSLWVLFAERAALLNGSFFLPLAPSNGFRLASFAVGMAFLWAVLHHFYVASFGISLKSISLKDIEMRPYSDNPDSILNRHLDEIIYFFQTTDYDLVVIEDLDRFDNADIFVTLREINGLVNANAGVKRTIRFLYALRDDMFVNTDRTKFFEFIIPVIPIINSSNSIDMVLEQGKRLALDERLDRQFLREVSRHLDDLRLIQNIFNEYAIYAANLDSDEENVLDANKLLAILIYKNVYPRDFEELHRGEGNLANILARQDSLIAGAEAVHRAEINRLEQQLAEAERQTPSDLKELRQIYAMALIQKFEVGGIQVSKDGQSWLTVQQLADDTSFDELLEAPSILYRTAHGQRHRLDLSSLQRDVDPRRTYLQRKSEIENKAAANKSESLRQIGDLKARMQTLRTIKFNELVRINSDQIDDLFNGFREKGDLARFLILEGYLDDTYYQYTSLFHSGRLSPNDNKFLIQIRAFITPDPDFPIDNPKEVAAAMRAADFGQSYVLNVKLANGLLSDEGRYADQLGRMFEFIASDFSGSEAFLELYYVGGQNRPALLSGLSRKWPGLVPAMLASARALLHVTELLANLPEEALRIVSAGEPKLSDFVARNLPQILAQVPEIAPPRLACLGFEIQDLAAVDEYPAVVQFMVEKGLFELSITNLEYIYRDLLGEKDINALRTANYTTLRLKQNVALERLERDFPIYLADVVLALEENDREDVAAIRAVLQHDDLDPADVAAFLARQENLLPSLEEVPIPYHAMLFETQAIEPTWANLLAFMKSEAFDGEVLLAFLEEDDVRASILKEPIPEDSDAQPLRKLLLEAAALSDAAYRDYVRALPLRFESFPEGLDPAKLRILIEEKAITFSNGSLNELPERALKVHYVAANIAAFLANPQEFELDDDFLEALLGSGISMSDKRAVVGLLDLATAAGIPSRAALIGEIVDATDADLKSLDAGIAGAVIANATPVGRQISLFNKLHRLFTIDDVRQVLASLPHPYSEITTGYMKPRLAKSPENFALVEWLAARKIISSWSIGGFFGDEIRVNLFRSK